MGMHPESHGCDVCLQSKDGLERVGEDLHRRAIAHFEPREAGHGVSYQNDFLHRCPLCRTAWLHQYWEIDTPETAFEEFGIRYAEWTRLSEAEVMEICCALESGDLLPQDRFRG